MIAAAMQKIPCDLTIENVKLVNVITGEIYPACVDVLDGTIARVREQNEATELESRLVYDGEGAFLIPGFIDTHVHVESTMMIPEQFGRAVLPWGTTTVVTDPHEIANVMGIPGVKFMLENSKRTPLRHYVLAPSCVPSVPGLEGAGASFGAKEIAELLDTPGVIGIAEVMDYVNVIRNEERMHSILAEGWKRDVFLQGHAPDLKGKELHAYLAAGPSSDHECRSADECAKKLRAGMHINLKASSLSDYLSECLKGLKGMRFTDFVSICTDDVHAKDIMETGHINRVVRKAIQCGFEPIDVIRFATINAAREYGFKDLGAIAPGYAADMQLVSGLDGRKPEAVFSHGRLVAAQGSYIPSDSEKEESFYFPNTVHLDEIKSPDDFVLYAPEGAGESISTYVVASGYIDGFFNKGIWEELPVTSSRVDIRKDPDLSFVSVCNRHGSGEMTTAVLRGFGLTHGAVASTISHDSHNFCVIYKDPNDAYLAAEELCRTGGGITVVDGRILATLALPVAGLMSLNPVNKLAAEVDAAERAIRTVCGGQNTFNKIALIALVVLQGTLISDKGIVDGPTQTIMPVFSNDKNQA
jgi:adenine deaminase